MLKYLIVVFGLCASAQGAQKKIKYLLFYNESAATQNDTSRLIAFNSENECNAAQKKGTTMNGQKIYALNSDKYPQFWSNCAQAEIEFLE